jgi:hypothetical protein
MEASSLDLSDGPGTLDDKRRKARYGVAYLRSVCSQAGMPVEETSPDEDVLAVDCEVKFAEASVAVQVKCTSRLTLGGKSASVPLKREWCVRWAEFQVPVYLVLVVVPKDIAGWLAHHHDGTFHATAAYWLRVYGREGTSVLVPKVQRLSAATFAQWHEDLLACFGARS